MIFFPFEMFHINSYVLFTAHRCVTCTCICNLVPKNIYTSKTIKILPYIN